MEDFDESMLAVAGVYAQVLFDLARERDREEQVARQLGELCRHMDEDEDFAVFVTSEAIDDDSRGRSLERLFRGRLDDTLLDTLQVMNAKGRLGLLGALHEQFTHVRHVGHNQVEVTVTSAVPLGRRERRELIDMLQRMTGKEIVLEQRVNQIVLGGLVVKIGDHLLDASLATQLKQMRRNLLVRAGEEIHSGKEYLAQA